MNRKRLLYLVLWSETENHTFLAGNKKEEREQADTSSADKNRKTGGLHHLVVLLEK